MASDERFYRGWDTHAYVAQARELLRSAELPELGARVELPRWTAALACAERLIRPEDAAEHQALRHVAACYDAPSGGCTDPELPGLNVCAAVVWATEEAERDSAEPSMRALWAECLRDIGRCCVAGIAHRMLAFAVASSRMRSHDSGSAPSQGPTSQTA
ncbi:Hypothetical protein UVM_LOCUS366 [uncultured virus]|nr:Hypothetical protein UVM_LOCUS366 [uncultured virus]